MHGHGVLKDHWGNRYTGKFSEGKKTVGQMRYWETGDDYIGNWEDE